MVAMKNIIGISARSCAACLAAWSVATASACAQPKPNEPGGKPATPAAPPAAKAPAKDADPGAKALTVAGVTLDIPSPFQPVEVKPGGMRAAQYTVHKPDDMEAPENGEIVFFYFGPQGAGGVEANIARWSSQVTDAGGKPVEPKLRVVEKAPLRITEATFVGTYASGMPGAEKVSKAGFTVIGAIVEGGPEGMVVARLTGPSNVVEANRALWERMVGSARAAAK